MDFHSNFYVFLRCNIQPAEKLKKLRRMVRFFPFQIHQFRRPDKTANPLAYGLPLFTEKYLSLSGEL
jgi:hypothetical protein